MSWLERNYDELLAIILVVGCLMLVFLGIDSEVKSILTMAAGWMFGREFVKRWK